MANSCYFCEKRLARDRKICPNCGQHQSGKTQLLKVGGIMFIPVAIFVFIIPLGVRSIGSSTFKIPRTTNRLAKSSSSNLLDIFGSKENSEKQVEARSKGLLGSLSGSREEIDELGSLFSSAVEASKDEESLIALYKSMGYSEKEINNLVNQAETLTSALVGGTKEHSSTTNRTEDLLTNMGYSKKEVKSIIKNGGISTLSNSGKMLKAKHGFIGDSNFNYSFGDPIEFPGEYIISYNSVENVGDKLYKIKTKQPFSRSNKNFIKLNYSMKNISNSNLDLYLYLAYLSPILDNGENQYIRVDENHIYLSNSETCPSRVSLKPGESKDLTVFYDFTGSTNSFVLLMESDNQRSGVKFSL